MNADCFINHVAYIKEWHNGIGVCLLCAAKNDIEQTASTRLLKAKMFDVPEPSEKTMEKIRCPKCEGRLFYFRMKLDEFVCRNCGHIWKKNSEIKTKTATK